MSSKKSKKPIQQNTVKSDGFCVYLGPTITGVIQSGTIYRGDKATVIAGLENAIKK